MKLIFIFMIIVLLLTACVVSEDTPANNETTLKIVAERGDLTVLKFVDIIGTDCYVAVFGTALDMECIRR